MSEQGSKKKNFDGVRSAAEVLNLMDQNDRERILKNIKERDPSLALKISEEMFVFEDFAKFQNEDLQEFLRLAPRDKLVLALRQSSDVLKDALFRNCSDRAAKQIREDIEILGPQRLSLVKAAQQQLIALAKKLISEGKIHKVLKKG